MLLFARECVWLCPQLWVGVVNGNVAMAAFSVLSSPVLAVEFPYKIDKFLYLETLHL